jgi:thiamine pyrophosphate-dependent acetolactate synthase large subunit-like protein
MKLLSDLIDGETLAITNLTTNARMWSALRGERPSFYGLNMGLCLPFAVGVALGLPKRRVVAIDGDGSLIIETSSLITAADVRPENLTAVVFDNGVYGGMGETATARRTDLAKMAEGAGIAHTATLRTMEEYEKALRAALAAKEFRFLVAKVERDDTLPFTGNYTKRSDRGMKESFVDAVKRLPDYPGER